MTAFTLFQPAVYSAVGVPDGATFVPWVATEPATVTSVELVSSPSVEVSRSTYSPAAVNRAIVEGDVTESNSARPPAGADTTLHDELSAPAGQSVVLRGADEVHLSGDRDAGLHPGVDERSLVGARGRLDAGVEEPAPP